MSSSTSVIISIADPSEYDKLGELTALAFAKDPLRLAAFHTVSDAEYARFMADRIRSLESELPPATRSFVIHARNPSTGDIVGWAKWLIPCQEEEVMPQNPQPKAVTLPEGVDEIGYAEHRARHKAACAEMLGDRKKYVLGFLAVSPTAQRTGAGSALIKWGCDRADQDGMPIFVSGSLVAAPLYAKFGFVAKDWSVIKYPITGKEVMQTNMMREPKTTRPDAVHSAAHASTQKIQIGSEP